MVTVTNINSSSWNTAINAINGKAKEAYVNGDSSISDTEKGIAKVKDAMNEMVDAFNEANVYVNFMDDLIFYYKKSIAMGRRVSGVRQNSLEDVGIVPDRGHIT